MVNKNSLKISYMFMKAIFTATFTCPSRVVTDFQGFLLIPQIKIHGRLPCAIWYTSTGNDRSEISDIVYQIAFICILTKLSKFSQTRYYWLLLIMVYGAVIGGIIGSIWKMSRCWWHHFQDKNSYNAFFLVFC